MEIPLAARSHKAFYDSRPWRQLRAAKLGQQPLCEHCALSGIVRPARIIDHVVSINNGGDMLPPLDDLQSLCIPCHNTKTRSHDNTHSVTRRQAKGCTLDGTPLCPNDTWGGLNPQRNQWVRATPIHGVALISKKIEIPL